jgi:hypothetical protein
MHSLNSTPNPSIGNTPETENKRQKKNMKKPTTAPTKQKSSPYILTNNPSKLPKLSLTKANKN